MLVYIPLIPLIGFLINANFGRRLSKSASGAIAVGAMVISFAVSVAAFVRLIGLPPEARAIVQQVYSWISSGSFQASFTLRLDPLSAVMILVVTGIGSLIHIYSTAYMHDEPDSEYARYFSYLNLFAAFMLVLVLGSADRVLVSEEVRLRRRQEGVHRQPHRRLRLRPRRPAAVRALRQRRLP